MISFHPGSLGAPVGTTYTRGFKAADIDDVARLAVAVSKYAWGVCVWKGGYRTKANFEAANWFGLDFESPDFSLTEAVKVFCDMQHVIGTTRNHQKAKGNLPPIDRFRVLIRASCVMRDVRSYEWNMRRLADKWPIDAACCDGARHFFRCSDIISICPDGYSEDVYEPPPQRTYVNWHARAGLPTPWASHQLKVLVPEGERSVTFYRVAKDFLRAGYTADDILGRIVASPTYQGSPSPHAMHKLEEAVRSAYNAVATEEVESE